MFRYKAARPDIRRLFHAAACDGVHEGQTRLGVHAAMWRSWHLCNFRRLSVVVVLGIFIFCYGDGDVFVLGMNSVREMGVVCELLDWMV